jgi:maltoporin
MKNLRGLFLLTLFWGGVAENAWAVSDDNFEYHGYMRSGVGSNLAGGDQTCYHQSGVPGNEFRLGNECGIYGENLFRIYTPDAKKDSGEFYRANFAFSYNVADNTDAAATNAFTIYGAYIEAGRLDGGDAVVWVGRRYYRDTDLHMDDFFYFADTSGSGAGVEEIPLFGAHYAVALMFQDEVQLNSDTSLPIMTQNGRPRTILLDNRLFDLKLSEGNSLNIWGGVATSTGGLDPTTHINYSNASGEVLGVKYSHDIEQGYNRLSAIYGRGLMQGMNLGGTFGTDPTQEENQPYDENAHRWRFVEDMMWQPSAHFATALAMIYESWSLGSLGGNNGRWLSAGARPIYFFTKHYSVAVEAGASSVRQANQTGSTPLYRMTIAPQISPKPEFYARPVLRAYLTRSWVPSASTQFISTATSFGFQGEIWF